MVSNNVKGILAIIGGFLLHLSMGSIYSFGLLNPFYVSYLHIYDPNLVPDDGFFLLPLSVLFFNSFPVVGGQIDAKVGTRV